MSNSKKGFRSLLRRMPAIAKAVNRFDSEALQEKAFDALIEAWRTTAGAHSSPSDAAPPAADKKPSTRASSTEQGVTKGPKKPSGGPPAQLSTEEILAQARKGDTGARSAKPPQAPAVESEPPPPQPAVPEAEAKESEVEGIKRDSHYLRGQIAEELVDGSDHFGKTSIQLLKHHGTYQQDDRDVRAAATGKSERSFIFMVRTKIPGGRLTSDQLLAELDLCDEVGNSTLRVTSRQGLQLHGVLKRDLKRTIRRINDIQLSTLGACGDLNRNVMCCPAPYRDAKHQEAQKLADTLAAHLAPRTGAYHELWLQEEGSDERKLVGGGTNGHEVEPIYGRQYMPRKFKIGVGFPFDNCVDLYTHDLAFMAVVRDDKIAGYNVLVGGGQGVTPSAKKTFPALAQRMAFVTPQQAVDVAVAVVKVQRDFGDRSDRKTARLKYLLHKWGLPRFKATVERYFGEALPDPDPVDVYDFNDHLGWEQQGDGRWFYGLNIENGRLLDTETMRLKSALRELCRRFRPGVHLTSHQSILLTDIAEHDKASVEQVLRDHHVPLSEDISAVRRWSMACVAWPTCGLSITEAERALPSVMDQLEVELARLGLDSEKFTVRMTGCPNGCARPYNSDIGLVGKTKGKYTVFVGGRLLGDRLNFVFKDLVPEEELVATLQPLFVYYKQDRQPGETFGDFCARKGQDDLVQWADTASVS